MIGARHMMRAACAQRSSMRCLAYSSAGAKANMFKALDKEHQAKSLKQIVKLPPGALKGLKAGKADEMLASFNIKTIADLARWKHIHAARAIAVLAKTEEEGKRPEGAALNINGIVDKAFECASFSELLDAPPSCLQGLAPWTDSALKDLRIDSVGKLAAWKYAKWAEALLALSAFERSDGSSR